MNKTDDIAKEMADKMVEMAEEWAAADAERARRYRIASIFLAERMLDDFEWVKKKIHLKEAVGSYVIRQRKLADDSLVSKIAATKKLIAFLKNADQEYFIGNEEEGKNNKEAVLLLTTLADYFRGDSNNLQLAKISNDIQDFQLSNIDNSKTIADAIVASLENSIRDIYK